MSAKALLGQALPSINIGSTDCLALQNLQIPEHSTNSTLPGYIFPRQTFAVVLQQSLVIGVWGAPTWRFEVRILGLTGTHFGPLRWSQWEALSLMHAAKRQA
eukprot:1156148-Pelagomonas_calceolata.AAC.2